MKKCLGTLAVTAAMMTALTSEVVQAGQCPVHEIYIIESSGYFNAPGVTPGRIGRLCSDNPAAVERLGEAAAHLGPMSWGGLAFAGADVLYGFENTTNSLRLLDIQGGNELIDSLGHIGSGISALALSQDGSRAYAAGTVSFWGRIVEADVRTGAVLSVHSIANLSAIGSMAVVPEDTDLPYEPGTLLAIRNVGFAPGAQLFHIDLRTDTATLIGGISGIGFNAAFESGLDFAPDGTLYAAIQGFLDGGGDVSTHLYTIDPATAAATLIGVIDAPGTWDAASLAVRPATTGAPGDLNGDGVVDVSDLLILLGAWGPCSGGSCDADLNDDGTVDVSDLLALLGEWG